MRLQDALRLLPPAEREALRARRRILIDPRKRLDEIEQLARALVSETDLRQSKFPSEVKQLLQRLVAVGGTLPGGAEEPGAGVLCDLGVTYRSTSLESQSPSPAPRESSGAPGVKARKPSVAPTHLGRGVLVLPSAFLVQAPVGEGEDPRCLRACFTMIDPEIIGPMGGAILGQPLGVGGAMALQEIWEAIAVPGAVERLVKELPSAEARLLDALERVGGEVNTQELLGLDQAPGLYRTQSGIAVPKRGAPYTLQRKALMFQLGVERFVIPSEVSAILGVSRQSERSERRRALKTARAGVSAPTRYQAARDPGGPVVAALAMFRAWEVAVRPEAGVARAGLRRAAERLSEPEEVITLLIALARAAGLSRYATPMAPSSSSMQVRACDVGELLTRTYLQGGAWDETRAEPEVLRSGLAVRSTTAAPAARQVLLDALDVVARDGWVDLEGVLKFAREDPRLVAARRLHERAVRERPELYTGTVDDALRVMLVRSLPAVGMVEISEDLSVVRMAAPRPTIEREREPEARVTRYAIEVPLVHRLDRVLALADIGEPDRVDPTEGTLIFGLGVGALARARSRALAAAQVEERFRGVGVGVGTGLPPNVEEIVRGVSAARESGFVACAGALMATDPSVRAELRADPGIRRMILDVEAGDLLLLRADADLTRLQTRLARLGVRLIDVSTRALSISPGPDAGSDEASADNG